MPETKNYKIAVVQLHPVRMQPESNYQRAVGFVRQAAEARSDLAVLPEYFLTGWHPEHPDFADLAEDRTYLEKFCQLAKELNINICPGTFVEKHVEGDETLLYNVAYFISNEGKILGSYTKKNLWHPEREHLESSGHNPHSNIDTPIGKVGLLICWDLAFPEAFRALIKQGAKIIIIPTFWTMLDLTPEGLARNPRSEEIFLNSTMASRAYENTACIVMANAGGPEEKGYAGLSQITMPFMGPIVKAEGTSEQLIIGDVDMEILEEAEANYKVRYDLSQPDFHYAAKF